MNLKKYIRHLSVSELRTIAALCAGAAVLMAVALLLSSSRPLGSSYRPHQQADQKPWVMELP